MLVAQTHPVHHPGIGRLDHDVGPFDQRQQSGSALIGLEVEHDAALAPIVGPELERRLGVGGVAGEGSPMAGRGPRRRFDHDDLGTEGGEHGAAQVTSLIAEIEHTVGGKEGAGGVC